MRASSSGRVQGSVGVEAYESVCWTGIIRNASAAVVCASARVGAGRFGAIPGFAGVGGAVLQPA